MTPRTHKPGYVPAEEAPLYWECSTCGYLSGDAKDISAGGHCPECTLESAQRRQFPAERLRKLDSRIRRYHQDGEYEIVVILAMTFLETLLEDILARIMETRGADVRLRALVLDTQRSIGQRIGKLFPTLTGEQFEDVAAQIGYRDFPYRWRQLRSTRNAFIHDSAFEGPQEAINLATAAEAMRLLDEAYRVFVLIHNRYVAQRVSKPGERP